MKWRRSESKSIQERFASRRSLFDGVGLFGSRRVFESLFVFAEIGACDSEQFVGARNLVASFGGEFHLMPEHFEFAPIVGARGDETFFIERFGLNADALHSNGRVVVRAAYGLHKIVEVDKGKVNRNEDHEDVLHGNEIGDHRHGKYEAEDGDRVYGSRRRHELDEQVRKDFAAVHGADGQQVEDAPNKIDVHGVGEEFRQNGEANEDGRQTEQVEEKQQTERYAGNDESCHWTGERDEKVLLCRLCRGKL